MNCVIFDGGLFVNGENIPWPNDKEGGHHICQFNGRLYIDGFEWRNGKWKRTLMAMIRCM